MGTRDLAGQARRLVLVLAAFAVLAISCSSGGEPESAEVPDPGATEPPTSGGGGSATSSGSVTLAGQGGSGPLAVRLSAGVAADQRDAEPVPVIDGDPLTDTEIDAIIDRLPEWSDDPGDQKDFNRPPDSLPPPRSGVTVDSTFPVGFDQPAPDVERGPLEVLRVQPEGAVDIAPVVSITFNQSMVPLGTLGQLAAEDVPATITPEVPGRWEWIGTRTLRFEHEVGVIDRLPMATDFVVEIPAGTTSVAGGELADSARFEFSTPPPSVERFMPQREGLPLDPVFFVEFDQVVDPDAVLEAITVEAGRDEVAIRLATDEEIDADDLARRQVSKVEDLPGRWLAFRAVDELPRDTAITITVGPGTPSAEGPRTSLTAEVFSARTFAPLRVADQNCRRDNRCQAFSPLVVQFNNDLDQGAFDPTAITIDPELPRAEIFTDGNRGIIVQGPTQGRTDYEVTYPAELTDVWGQTLGEDVTLRFRIGEAPPQLVPFRQQLITADPSGEPTISVTSINHERYFVEAYAVEPSDWGEYLRVFDQRVPESGRYEIPGSWQRVLDETVRPDADADAFAETAIDLSDALGADHGHLVVVVTPEEEFLDEDHPWHWSNRQSLAWVQVTDIAVDAFNDHQQLVLWTTDLATGAPLAGIELELGGQTAVSSGSNGLAFTDVPGGDVFVVARRAADSAILVSPFDRWGRDALSDAARWHVFDDRGLYRPGETVNIKGWVRKLTLASDAQLAPVARDAEVSYVVWGPQGNEIATGAADVSALGGFDFAVDLPVGTNLGWAQVELTLQADGLAGRGWSHQFQIQEFRRPEFEVTTTPETPGPYLRTEPATVGVEATYFAGGPLPDAPVDWTVTTRDTSYSPPNWPDYTFGTWVPWWIFDDFGGGFGADVAFEADVFPGPEIDPGEVETFAGVTDASGRHFLRIDFEGDEMDQPVTVSANAAVTDVNRQTWADTADLLVHPADVYVGLRSERTFVRQGDPLPISGIAVDIDGEVVAGRPVTLTAERIDWRIVDGRWQEVAVDPQTCEVTSGDEPFSCEFTTDRGGEYRVTAIVVDEADRANRTELTRWVSGGTRPPVRRVEQEQVTLIPDKATYEPGDVAEILVEAPFDAAAGVLTLTRPGIVSTTSFELDGTSAVLEVPIAAGHIPGLHLQVDVTGSAPRQADDGSPLPDVPHRPAFATGMLRLDVPPTSRTLTVVAEPADDALEPGGATSLALTVTDAAGDPVRGAELAVVVVDEAVLALTDYELADPMASFYADLGTNLRSRYLRHTVLLDNPLALAEGGSDLAANRADLPAEEAAEEPAAFAADDAGGGESAQGPDAIDVRTNFDALAVFEPEVTTDADGAATVAVPLPDNLTRYRAMVVAVNGADEFGTGESNITARLPLMARPSAPRFLNFGDAFELPVVLQNQTDEAMDADVIVQTSNLELTDVEGVRVSIPANDRVEVRFPTSAVEAGTARFRVAAVSGDLADAATVALPVYTPATAEAFATYGVVDDATAVIQPVLAPTDVWPQFGGLEINTSSTALQALTDAVLYIADYRYESADALASRILAITALRDVLSAFDAEGLPPASDLLDAVQRDLDALAGLQNGDGGFPIWSRSHESWPYHTVHVTHALVEAQRNGYDVPQNTLARALDYLRQIEEFYDQRHGPVIRATISAYALHVRHLAGETDTPKAENLYRNSTDLLSLEAMAWLWPVISDNGIDAEIERLFTNRATETAGAATFATDYGESAYLVLHSSRRTDGVILDALIAERPDSDLVPKVVAGLLANQTKGRWHNMQENTFILLALNNYFDTFEAVDPDFVARVWLGDTYAAEHEYQGRSTERNQTLVPMAELIDAGDSDLVVAKDGADGRLYYRLGLRYAPEDLDLDPLDRGFVVQRTYEGVDDPEDVWLDDDGVWHVSAGAEVRVRLTMVADSRRTHVALIDPMAAGLESLNPALATTPDVPPDDNAADASYFYWRWFQHQNLRDDRAEAFTTILWAGTYEYTYVARATTPGRFVTPPARAEEMYAPETFGRSGTDILVVEP